MNTGFGHFDRAHTENFASAVLCLLVEVDDDVRAALVEGVAAALGVADLGPLTGVQREEGYEAGERVRRADLCVSVPLKGRGRLGIYRYVEAPPGHEAALADAWLELYHDDPHRPVHWVRFAPADLGPEALDAVRAEFRESWAARAATRG